MLKSTVYPKRSASSQYLQYPYFVGLSLMYCLKCVRAFAFYHSFIYWGRYVYHTILIYSTDIWLGRVVNVLLCCLCYTCSNPREVQP